MKTDENDELQQIAENNYRLYIEAKRKADIQDDLLEALYTALPFVEDALEDPTFKPGEVSKRLKVVTNAIAKAEAVKS